MSNVVEFPVVIKRDCVNHSRCSNSCMFLNRSEKRCMLFKESVWERESMHEKYYLSCQSCDDVTNMY